jgi:hypothetical protein
VIGGLRRELGETTWGDRIQSYVDAWAATAVPENVITEEQPHDDRALEAYIEWCTPRTRTHVMHVPAHPPLQVPDVQRIIPSITYPVRRD